MTRKIKREFSRKNFIILPIVFFIGAYGILYFALSPLLAPFIGVADMFFSDQKLEHDREYNNIFVPIEDTIVQETVNASDITYPKYGEMFGKISVENTSVQDVNLFFGDGSVALRNGVGIFNGSFVPGYGKTILVAGHNNTYFNGLKNAQEGAVVTIHTSYGNYTYSITKTEVRSASGPSELNLGADEENLVLYTCYPFDELGLTNERFFVYARFVSGPKIIMNE